jgi:hypothetical protein
MRSGSNGSRIARRSPRQRDGLGQWRKTLDRYFWSLRRAGIAASTITTASATSLRRHRKVRALAIPPLAVLLYSRVLTYWQNELRYLDGEGKPKALPRDGGRINFRSLVRHALDRANPAHVLRILVRHRMVSQDRSGNLCLRKEAFVAKGRQQRAHSLGYALMAVEAAVDTCYATLRATRPSQHRGRVQRMVFSENFDPRFLAQYDEYQRETIGALLAAHNAWLKRHEIKGSRRRRVRSRLVGTGVNGVWLRLD